MIKIDKGIPLTDGPPKGRNMKYPWDVMEIGDSFLSEMKTAAAVTSAVSRAGHVYKRKFTARKDGNGFRVWRVA